MKINKILFFAAGFALVAGAASAADVKAQIKPETTTLENLQSAYNGALKAKSRYEAFAAKAEEESYLGAAALFRAAALSKEIRAARYAGVMGGGTVPPLETVEVKSTKQNLKTARDAENYEAKNLSPGFLKKAQTDKNDKAAISFKGSLAMEKANAKLFSQALSDVNAWKAKKKFIVCQTCGYATSDLTIKVCPVCSQPREQFKEVE